MTRSRAIAGAAAITLGGLVAVGQKVGIRTLLDAPKLLRGRTVGIVVRSREGEVKARLSKDFERAGVEWPAGRLAIVALKAERRLEVWGRSGAGWRLIRDYPILAASGRAGPKLREGDRQVPEGLYRLDGLNPNSQFYLSLRVNYPSEEDVAIARREGRTDLGGDIFIHGNAVSIGCIAIGDEAIEEVFILAARAGRPVPILIAPRDFRRVPPTDADAAGPPWLKARYKALSAAMAEFPGS